MRGPAILKMASISWFAWCHEIKGGAEGTFFVKDECDFSVGSAADCNVRPYWWGSRRVLMQR